MAKFHKNFLNIPVFLLILVGVLFINLLQVYKGKAIYLRFAAMSARSSSMENIIRLSNVEERLRNIYLKETIISRLDEEQKENKRVKKTKLYRKK